MTKFNLNVDKRSITGSQVKTLRLQGTLPANIFGHQVDSLAVQVKAKDFEPIFNQAGETQVVYLNVNEEKAPRPVLIGQLQFHPISGKVIHIDFHQVNLNEKVTAHVPLEIIGDSAAVKELGANIISIFTELEVEALPTDLPEKFILDISRLALVGDTIKVSDLNFDSSKVQVTESVDTVLVTVVEKQQEEVLIAPVTVTPEAGAEAKPQEVVPTAAAK